MSVNLSEDNKKKLAVFFARHGAPITAHQFHSIYGRSYRHVAEILNMLEREGCLVSFTMPRQYYKRGPGHMRVFLPRDFANGGVHEGVGHYMRWQGYHDLACVEFVSALINDIRDKRQGQIDWIDDGWKTPDEGSFVDPETEELIKPDALLDANIGGKPLTLYIEYDRGNKNTIKTAEQIYRYVRCFDRESYQNYRRRINHSRTRKLVFLTSGRRKAMNVKKAVEELAEGEIGNWGNRLSRVEIWISHAKESQISGREDNGDRYWFIDSRWELLGDNIWMLAGHGDSERDYLEEIPLSDYDEMVFLRFRAKDLEDHLLSNPNDQIARVRLGKLSRRLGYHNKATDAFVGAELPGLLRP